MFECFHMNQDNDTELFIMFQFIAYLQIGTSFVDNYNYYNSIKVDYYFLATLTSNFI
jgi:hypothetical protein